MKIKTRGFSVVEFILVAIVIIVVGLFIFFVSKNKNTANQTTNQSTQVSEQDLVVDYVKQIVSDAESRYNGSYSPVFLSGNTNKNNGSGIVLGNGSVGSLVVDQVSQKGGSIFVITNQNNSAYAVYATVPSSEGAYYCMASDGSKQISTKNVVDINGLSQKPICR